MEETGDPEYSTLFGLAERLHTNFYRGFMSEKSFKAHRSNAKKLVEKLRRYIHEKHGVKM